MSYDKVFKNLIQDDGKEYKISVCAPIFISRKKKDLIFPMYIKNSDQEYFDVTHIQNLHWILFVCFIHY